MISIYQRKDIYLKHFVDGDSIRKISKDLNISRDTIAKITKEQLILIEKHNLENKDDLIKFIDIVVEIPKRKKRDVDKYKVTQYHIDIIKELIQDDKLNRVFEKTSKTSLDLFNDFCFEVKCEGIEPISYSTFYKLFKETKKTY